MPLSGSVFLQAWALSLGLIVAIGSLLMAAGMLMMHLFNSL
jgi:hypothetical protein